MTRYYVVLLCLSLSSQVTPLATGGKAKAWCLLIHADASHSLVGHTRVKWKWMIQGSTTRRSRRTRGVSRTTPRARTSRTGDAERAARWTRPGRLPRVLGPGSVPRVLPASLISPRVRTGTSWSTAPGRGRRGPRSPGAQGWRHAPAANRQQHETRGQAVQSDSINARVESAYYGFSA